MFQLKVKTGTNKGASWPLRETPLVVGRSTECDVVIPDPLVSRRHCEFQLSGESVLVRDLGSSNATLLNGQPVDEQEICVSDEIAVGPYTFVLTVASNDTAEERGIRAEKETPLTVSLSNALFLHETGPGQDVIWMPRNLYEFRDLFLLTRKLSRCTHTRPLLDEAVATLSQRFAPEALWYASILPHGKNLLLHDLDFTGYEEDAPLETMRQAVSERSGVLITNYQRGHSPRRLETTVAAPTVTGDRVLGVLAMRGATPGRIYDESDLEFFVAIVDSLTPHLDSAMAREQMSRDLNGLARRSGAQGTLIGTSQPLQQILRLADRAAESDLSVLILGETGVGKELIARRIHDLSDRAERPFVTVNCASIPRDLCESELFGHEKGAFTGATQRRIGRFEEAHTGTLFLDEIGDLPLDAQVSILRAVELGTFHRIGNSREHKVNVRIVAATNRPLADDVASGTFRADLYHRLCGLEILVPPLRQRKEDIPPLAEFFMAQAGASRGNEVRGISDGAMKTLLAWGWPGNVRELRLCIERAVVLSRSPEIQAEDLVMRGSGGAVPEHSAPRDEAAPTTMADAEKQHITRVLDENRGNIRATARALEISRATLYAKLKAYGIEP